MSFEKEEENCSASPEVRFSPGGSRRFIRGAKKYWKSAVLRAKELTDPWVELGFEDIQEETVTRHMYNPKNRKWRTDEIVIKIQSKVSVAIVILVWWFAG